MDDTSTPIPVTGTRWQRLADRARRLWRALHPSPPARRGAGLGIAAVVAVLAALVGVALQPGLGAVGDPAAGIAVALAFAALVALSTVLAVRLVNVLPGFIGWLGLAALGTLVVVFTTMHMPPAFALGAAVSLAAVEAVLGGALGLVLAGGLRGAGAGKRLLTAAVLVAGTAANVFVVVWLVRPGDDAHLVAAERSGAEPPLLDVADPGARGQYEVRTLTYGSGNGHRRPEFGEAAALTTEPVDATPFVKGNSGFKMKARKWYWGFGPEQFPLNGTVWYPAGDGPFPLVLVVHGNHSMEEYSDPGYAYLGEHLASRGMIVVSVDENFFNGSWAGGLTKENDGRGWLLLEHLKVWRRWATEAGNPFAGRVDMDRIALIGHSRGGEAVAIAGAFNRLPAYPDDATVRFDFDFPIRTVIAIAPSDGQYEPADRPTPLENVDYLTLQGGHDADVSLFMGDRQYQRVRFTDGAYHVKASLYAYRANHGQFNTVWGRTDFGFPGSLFLNTRPLLDGDAQRRLGLVAMTAFLEASLDGRRAPLAMFRDHRTARHWLPEDIMVTRFQDSTFRPLADFEEDVDVTTAAVPGAEATGDGLSVWREEHLPLRKRSRFSSVAVLGWRAGAATPPAWAVTVPETVRPDAGDRLVFCLAELDESLPEEDDTEAEDGGDAADDGADEAAEADDRDAPRPPLHLSVEVVDADGTAVRLPLARFHPVPPVLRSRFTKIPGETAMYGSDTEAELQTFEVPLAAFAAADAAFDPAAVASVRLVFDGDRDGVVALDDLGFAGPATAVQED